MAWTEGMDQLVRDEALKKTSSSQIAGLINRKFGLSLTRNAVIGYAHRKGISLYRFHSSTTITRLVAQRKSRSPNKVIQAGPPRPHRERVRLPMTVYTTPQMLTIDKLDSVHCHWPMWRHDGNVSIMEKFFCGADTETAYCPAHTRKSLRRLERLNL